MNIDEYIAEIMTCTLEEFCGRKNFGESDDENALEYYQMFMQSNQGYLINAMIECFIVQDFTLSPDQEILFQAYQYANEEADRLRGELYSE